MILVGDGDLVFLLFIPVLCTIWIWVHLLRACLQTCVLTRVLDDRIKTCNYLFNMSSFLQFPRHVLLCQCSSFSGQVPCRAL